MKRQEVLRLDDAIDWETRPTDEELKIIRKTILGTANHMVNSAFKRCKIEEREPMVVANLYAVGYTILPCVIIYNEEEK